MCNDGIMCKKTTLPTGVCYRCTLVNEIELTCFGHRKAQSLVEIYLNKLIIIIN